MKKHKKLIKKTKITKKTFENIINECMIGYNVSGTMKGCITESELPKLIKKLKILLKK